MFKTKQASTDFNTCVYIFTPIFCVSSDIMKMQKLEKFKFKDDFEGIGEYKDA